MLQQYINSHRESFNAYMMGLIEKENIPNELKESMLYSLSVGGKRLRPIILFAVLETLGLDAKKGYPTAAALEMIHTYSFLIMMHTDALPTARIPKILPIAYMTAVPKSFFVYPF